MVCFQQLDVPWDPVGSADSGPTLALLSWNLHFNQILWGFWSTVNSWGTEGQVSCPYSCRKSFWERSLASRLVQDTEETGPVPGLRELTV